MLTKVSYIGLGVVAGAVIAGGAVRAVDYKVQQQLDKQAVIVLPTHIPLTATPTASPSATVTPTRKAVYYYAPTKPVQK